MEQTINFYSHTKGQYSCFSNFSPHPVTIGGKYYSTTEHYFQSQKFLGDDSYMEKIRLAPTPAKSKLLGGSRTHKMRADWEQCKENVMLIALREKFTSNLNLRKILLDTGTAKLVERTANDSYWGDGGDGTGLNRLGYCLEETRRTLLCK